MFGEFNCPSANRQRARALDHVNMIFFFFFSFNFDYLHFQGFSRGQNAFVFLLAEEPAPLHSRQSFPLTATATEDGRAGATQERRTAALQETRTEPRRMEICPT